MARRTIFSSESVTRGHPDKICDQISDAIVDGFLYLDPDAEVAAECAVATGLVFLAVNAASSVSVDITEVARRTIADIGYTKLQGFDPDGCSVITSVSHRSAVTGHLERRLQREMRGASHQASVFGFACTQTPERMPLPITLAHRVAARLDEARQEGQLPYLGPDGKVLVAVEFEDRRPTRAHTVIVNVQHAADLDRLESGRGRRLDEDIRAVVLRPVFDRLALELDAATRVLVNPGGAFLVGGPQRDSGLTGRKNMVDTYGGYVRHGGGALSGKDPTHADRFGAYVARYVARNVVAADLARECEVHLSYAIGESRPLAASVQTFETGRVPDEILERAVAEVIDLRPGSIIERFGLQELPARHAGTFYRRLAAYGQLGRLDVDLPWEHEDEASRLAQVAGRLG